MRHPWLLLIPACWILTAAAFAADELAVPGLRAGETAVGPDGGTYVWVPPGEFMMGSGEEGAQENERPLHPVRLSKGFWLSRCEVTLGQWKAYCHRAGIELKKAQAPGEEYPVGDVNWEEAAGYCRSYGLALPTEAQWEYAARGPEPRRYPWGDEWDETLCCNSDRQGPQGSTFPAGSFPKATSWCGALDLAGSLWEWCADWYDPAYYAASPEADPGGPEKGDSRILRGGSFAFGSDRARCAGRNAEYPYISDRSGGFRPVRVP